MSMRCWPFVKGVASTWEMKHNETQAIDIISLILFDVENKFQTLNLCGIPSTVLTSQ